MGCWNGTCGITQTPIISGTKVKAVIIKNKSRFPEASGFCYSSGYADIFSFVFSGIYDDYGSIEDIIEDAGTRTFMEWFHENLLTGKLFIQPDRMTEDKTENYSDISFEELINLMERDRVFYNDRVFFYNENPKEGEAHSGYNTVVVNLGFMMVHESVFNTVGESMFASSDYNHSDFSKKSLIQDCKYAYDELISSNTESISSENLVAAQAQIDALPKKEGEKYELLKSLIDSINFVMAHKSASWDTPISKSGEYSNSVLIFRGAEGSDMKIFSHFLKFLQAANNTEKDVVKVLSDTILLMSIMSTLRKPWMAQSGKGSQSFDEDTILALAQSIKDIAYSNREDLTGCDLYCAEDFTAHYAGSSYNFQKDKEYICQKMEEESLLMDNGCYITYSEFQKYFEY